MFEQFNAKVDIKYKGESIANQKAECVINAVGISIDNLTIPMSNIVFYTKSKSRDAMNSYSMTIHVVNWVK